jgi:hypothetical protein
MNSEVQTSRNITTDALNSHLAISPSDVAQDLPMTLALYCPPLNRGSLRHEVSEQSVDAHLAGSVFKSLIPTTSRNPLSSKERTLLLIQKVYPSDSIERVFDSANKELYKDIQDIVLLKEALTTEDPTERQAKLEKAAIGVDNPDLIPLLSSYLSRSNEVIKSKELVKVGLGVNYSIINKGAKLAVNLIRYGSYEEAASLVESMDSYLEFPSIDAEEPLRKLSNELTKLKFHFIELFAQAGKYDIALCITNSLKDPISVEEIKEKISLKRAVFNELKAVFIEHEHFPSSLRMLIQAPLEFQRFIENLIVNEKHEFAHELSMKLEMSLCLLSLCNCKLDSPLLVDDSIDYFRKIIHITGELANHFLESEQYDKALELGLSLGSVKEMIDNHPTFENQSQKTKSLNVESTFSKNTLCTAFINKGQYQHALILGKTIHLPYFRAGISLLLYNANRKVEALELAETLRGSKFEYLVEMILSAVDRT